jgi:diguanylate cyclase (GGDEF)-like protein
VRLSGAGAAALLVLRGDVLVAGEAVGLSEPDRDRLVVPLEDSVYGRALLSGEAQVEAAGDDLWRTVVASPLRSNRTTYGALALFFSTERLLDEEEKAALHTLALQAAIALDNRRLMQEKERMAVHDGLTDVYNRGYLELAIDRAVKEVDRRGGDLSVLFVDVDGMKDVNDTHGHQAGDALLVDLARLLSASCRASDVVARYGGDEFVVLMSGTDAAGAEAVAHKVAAAIAAHNASGRTPRLSASVGTHTAGAGTAGTLLREADRRMYAVKRARGRRHGRGSRRGAAPG